MNRTVVVSAARDGRDRLTLCGSFVAVASVILAPLQVSGYRVSLLAIPACLVVSCRRWDLARGFLQTVDGRLGVAVIVLLTTGHLFGRDDVPGWGAGNSVLGLEILSASLAAFVTGGVLAQSADGRFGLKLALFAGLSVHVAAFMVVSPVLVVLGHGRLAGLGLDPNTILLHVLPPSLLLYAVVQSASTPVIALSGLTHVSAVLVTLSTLSRGGAVSALVGTLGIAASSTGRRMALILLVTLGFLLSLYLPGNRIADRAQLIADGYYARVNERATQVGLFGDRIEWVSRLGALDLGDLVSPVGPGYGLYMGHDPTLPHNTFVDAFVIGGWPAAALFMAIYARLLVRALTPPPGSKGVIGRPSSLIGFVTAQLVLLSVLSVIGWKLPWMLLGVACALSTPSVIPKKQPWPIGARHCPSPNSGTFESRSRHRTLTYSARRRRTS